jgi:gamma-glutamylcyclotransferase (GGCT)/AIG2-like uncharacterized protein YtfP
MIRYFAYGHNTNVEEFARRIPTAKRLGKACLPNYRLVMREFADVVPKKNEKVWGVLWDVPAGWISELDELEVHYKQKNVVVIWNNLKVGAMAYVMDDLQEGPPTLGYINSVSDGYHENKLPLRQLNRAL